MGFQKYIVAVGLSVCTIVCMQAAQWKTHFAYNNVTQIALAPEKVYAISDGSLFSVDKHSEIIRVYNRQSGLNGVGINCIHYDNTGEQLIIGYNTGKIDILSSRGVQYIGELYDKDMTQRKNIYNVTIKGRTAYLSTHYGVQTLDLRENKLVDAYWLRPNGEETPVKDVLIANDSIYAFTEDSLFCAAMSDNLVDYTFWKRELRTGRISPDAQKGQHYVDGSDQWYAGYGEGIVRYMPTGRIAYKPQGPLVNKPYRLTATQGSVWVVPGGRWSSQNETSGVVMRYNGSQWLNVDEGMIMQKTGMRAMDFMNVAVDPQNRHHYFVTSYGTGLYEFDMDSLLSHHVAGGDNTLIALSRNHPNLYTRLDGAVFDAEGNVWMLNSNAVAQLQCLDAAHEWHAVALTVDGNQFELNTPAGLVLDRNNPNYKWIAAARSDASVGLLDDRGTRFDSSDDRFVVRMSWIDQHGREFVPAFVYAIMQDVQGRVWIGSENGLAYISPETDYFESGVVVRPDIMDNNGENPMTTQAVNAICQTPEGEIWVGTKSLGVYVLNREATEIIAHYTTDNSAMSSNAILSLAADERGVVFIGTADGLVEYNPHNPEEGMASSTNTEQEWDEGTMLQWKLHLSYRDATEVAASPRHVYAVGQGSLFSVDRSDETPEYWSRATGLNGNKIVHIAYDGTSGYLVVAYEDGRIDLIDDDGNVKQMPDLYMKAGSIAMTVNSINIGSKYVYLAMTFGIVAINPRKGEVIDTYYIGPDGASLDVAQVIEKGDSLYAFTTDRIYAAALNDNLADYTYWHQLPLITDRLQKAVVHGDKLYILQHDSLYCQNGNTWQLVLQQPVDWIRESGGQLLMCTDEHNVSRLAEDHQFVLLRNNYAVHDAVYSQGEYWLAETHWGLIRLASSGDSYYHPTGPNSNFGYFMTNAHKQVYSVIGGRWAGEYARFASVNVFTGSDWISRDYMHILSQLHVLHCDPVSIAVDRQDAGHFYVAMYGTGVLEFKDYNAVNMFTYNNSTLRPVNSTINPNFYTRTDGLMIDEEDNLWVLNATYDGYPVHVMKPNGVWTGIPMVSGGENIQFTTPAGTWSDKRNSQYKWMFDQRSDPKVVLLDDGGTPTYTGDDKCRVRRSFVDQNGNTITPSNFYSFAQDKTNRIWIGTEKGILTIPSTVDFFSSNACRRIIVPRNDGTGLGDYLLGEEQIKCMAVDGGNRMWIGTASSGLYVIEDDTITVAHFTENNSLLPSNAISSITIVPETGEVFVGTDRGIASYRSDASEPQATMNAAYAFPNPVRPDYDGAITIVGLMDNTVVNIIDAGGNLVCKTRSHGGTAVWDGKLPDGRRATAGVYTALCNAENGHTVVKILVIR